MIYICYAEVDIRLAQETIVVKERHCSLIVLLNFLCTYLYTKFCGSSQSVDPNPMAVRDMQQKELATAWSALEP